MLYSQRVWNAMGEDASERIESTYSDARSESPSEYSGRGWGSTASLHQDLDGRHSFAPSMRTANAEDERDEDPVEDNQVDEDAGPGLQRGLSVMGPKTRFVTRAPWEPGGDDDLQEEEEETNDAETRSLFGGRGRSKKPKESAKARGFPASFTPRASSSSRPSEDVSTPTSSSSGGRFKHQNRPGSIGTANSNTSELPFPSPRYERPVIGSPRSMRRDRTDSTASHPYANPDNIPSPLPYQERFPPSPVNHHHNQSTGFPAVSKMHSLEYASNPQAVSTPIDDTHPVPHPAQLPTKMAPWKFTPSSPTFQLVSLEEAQAMKARQRQMSLNTNANGNGATDASIRTRAISAGTRKASAPVEPTAFGSSEDVSAPKQVLKGRKSLLGLFAKARDKERSLTPRPESPPPMPSLPTTATSSPRMQNLPSPMASSTLFHSAPASATPTPTPQETTHPKPPKRVPPPSLNVVVTSPQLPDTQESTHVQPPSIHHVQKSANSSPTIPSTLSTPRKKTSAVTLSPVEKPTGKPNSAPSNVQGFTGLSLRPISTMFTSMPSDYLANVSSPPPVPGYMSTSSTGHFSTQSPTTPSLISSRSESISTGSSEQPPTPGGLLHSTSTGSTEGGGHSLSLLHKQVYGAREVWRGQISDLEAQVRALQAEVAALKRTPCPSCGHLGGGCSGTDEKISVVNRPRAKTAAGASRTLFGNAD